MVKKRVTTWPVWIISAAAAVTIWAGWVGLGSKTGFGIVQPLPGIWDSFRFNLSITLPIGMEAYASYAMWISLNRDVSDQTRSFAKVSGYIAFAVGAAGQLAFHAMESFGVTVAPLFITMLVSIVPVAVLALAMSLAHRIREDEKKEEIDSVTSSTPPVIAPVIPEPVVVQPIAPVYPTVRSSRPDVVSVPDPPRVVAPIRPIRMDDSVSPRDFARRVLEKEGSLEVGDMYKRFPDKSHSSLRSALYAVKKQLRESEGRNREVS